MPAPAESHISPYSPSCPSSSSSASQGKNAYQVSTGDRAASKAEDVARNTVLHVGIDYGTTFTSSAVNDSRCPDKVVPVTEWSLDLDLCDRPSVPTENWYPKKSKWTKKRKRSAEDIDSPKDKVTGYDLVGVLFGYEIAEKWNVIDDTRTRDDRVAQSKLVLLDTDFTEASREYTRNQVGRLTKSKQIRNGDQVYSDILIKVLEHTRRFATANHNYNPTIPVKFALTVPTAWSQGASRTLQTALESAIRCTGFGMLQNDSIPDLFIIYEAEAAMSYILANTEIVKLGEIVVLLDAGGGTVDTVTYSVRDTAPLSLQREEVIPGGDNCGAAYLNENFRTHLMTRLKGETYLERNGEELETIVDRLIPDFENRLKRRININEPCTDTDIYISGLLPDREKRFMANYLIMNRNDWIGIFEPLLARVKALLQDQFEQSFKKGLKPQVSAHLLLAEIFPASYLFSSALLVKKPWTAEKPHGPDWRLQKVFLTGGFGAAPSLRDYIQAYIVEVMAEMECSIVLINDRKNSTTAVACGAVLRHLDKENGPERISRSSYGFLRREEWSKEVLAHKNQRARRDPIDQLFYIRTIDYFVVIGERIPPTHTWGPIPCYYTFLESDTILRCVEQLFVSDSATERHYAVTHPKNKDARIVGRIVIDVTPYRRLFDLVIEKDDKGKTVRYVQVWLDLKVTVEGRNMRFYAVVREIGHTSQTGQISIAAAFIPGTK